MGDSEIYEFTCWRDELLDIRRIANANPDSSSGSPLLNRVELNGGQLSLNIAKTKAFPGSDLLLLKLKIGTQLIIGFAPNR